MLREGLHKIAHGDRSTRSPGFHYISQMHYRAACFAITLLACSGCAQWGGRVLEDNHTAFNTAVSDSMDSQMLLNVVRLSHDAPTQWMTVSAINVNTSVSVGVNGAATIPSSGIVSGAVGGASNFVYTPNITYIPRQGEQLARELMSPIPVASIESLVSSSWPISWVMFLTCEQVQGVSSFDVTRGFGVTVRDARFGRLMQLLDELQAKELVSLSLSSMPVTWNLTPIAASQVTLDAIVDAKADRATLRPLADGTYDYVSIEHTPVLTGYPGIETDPAGTELLTMLELPMVAGSSRMVSVESPVPGNRVGVRTRSLSALLRLMSFGVDRTAHDPGPDPDMDSPRELWSRLASGANAGTDLSSHVNGVFRVHRGESVPSTACVKVFYRGEWYWIDTNDQTSKQVFALMRDLFDLQVKNDAQQTPVLTIPVG